MQFVMQRELPSVRDSGADLHLGAPASMLPAAIQALAVARRQQVAETEGSHASWSDDESLPTSGPFTDEERALAAACIAEELALYGFSVCVVPPSRSSATHSLVGWNGIVQTVEAMASSIFPPRCQILVFISPKPMATPEQAGVLVDARHRGSSSAGPDSIPSQSLPSPAQLRSLEFGSGSVPSNKPGATGDDQVGAKPAMLARPSSQAGSAD